MKNKKTIFKNLKRKWLRWMTGTKRASYRFCSCNICLRMCFPSILNVSSRKKRLDLWLKWLRNGCSNGFWMSGMFRLCNCIAGTLRLQRRRRRFRWLRQRDSLKLKLRMAMEWMLPRMASTKQDKMVNKHSTTEEQEPSRTTAFTKMDPEPPSLQETHPTSRT